METTGVDASDIADFFAWMSSSGKLTMIQTINAAELSDAAYYVFHIGRADNGLTVATGPATDQTRVICWYEAGETSCVVDNGGDTPVDQVQGSATAELASSSGNFRVHVDQHADPFYFYLTGFINARNEVLQYAPALASGAACGAPNGEDCFDEFGCPDIAGPHPEAGTNAYPAYSDGGTPGDLSDDTGAIFNVLQGILTGAYDDAGMATTATNSLEGNNVTGIVVELDTSLLAGTGDFLQVWGATHERSGG